MPSDGLARGEAEIRPPTLTSNPSYETVTASIDVPVPLVAFSHWFDQRGSPELGSFLKGTATVPGVVRSEPLIGGWHDPGDRRKLIFADGASALEQILDKGLLRIRVEMWNLRNDTGRYIAYAVDEFTLSETPTGTRVTWTTDFEPKVQPPDGWLIRSEVLTDYREFMQQGLIAMAESAVLDVGSTNLSQ